MKKKLLSSALLLLALTISACSSPTSSKKSKEVTTSSEQSSESQIISSEEQNSSSEEEDPQIVDNSGFKNINDEEPFEIHTEAQKTFLEYDGNYTKMSTTDFPDGTKHLSDSLPIKLTWNYDLSTVSAMHPVKLKYQ